MDKRGLWKNDGKSETQNLPSVGFLGGRAGRPPYGLGIESICVHLCLSVAKKWFSKSKKIMSASGRS